VSGWRSGAHPSDEHPLIHRRRSQPVFYLIHDSSLHGTTLNKYSAVNFACFFGGVRFHP
jgi:hypothetical protein